LQDRLIEDGILGGGLVGREAVEGLRQVAFVKQRAGNEPLLLDEPAEDKPRNEADDADVVVAVGFLGRVLGKANVL
jgi:hypothetical protein